MSNMLELRLPDEVMENLPVEKAAMVDYVSSYIDEVIKQYEDRFVRRVQGVVGGPFSRYEKSFLKTFLMDEILGRRLEAQEEDPKVQTA